MRLNFKCNGCNYKCHGSENSGLIQNFKSVKNTYLSSKPYFYFQNIDQLLKFRLDHLFWQKWYEHYTIMLLYVNKNQN